MFILEDFEDKKDWSAWELAAWVNGEIAKRLFIGKQKRKKKTKTKKKVRRKETPS